MLILLSSLAAVAQDSPAVYTMRSGAIHALIARGQLEKAREECHKLWVEVLKPANDPVRTRFYLDEFAEVLDEEKFRGELQYYFSLRNDGTAQELGLYYVLEQRFGSQEKALEWYRNWEEPTSPRYSEIRPMVFETLVKAERWEEAGKLFPDPLGYAEGLLDAWDKVAENDEEMRWLTDRWRASTMGQLHRSLLAAGRDGEAGRLKELLLTDKVLAEKNFIDDIFKTIFQQGEFYFADGTELLMVYRNERYNLEFHFDSHLGPMVYGGMYVRVRESDEVYRLNEMLEYFDPENRNYKKLSEPYKSKNTIDLRTHAGLIESHLLEVLKGSDTSWEDGVRAYIKAKFPY